MIALFFSFSRFEDSKQYIGAKSLKILALQVMLLPFEISLIKKCTMKNFDLDGSYSQSTRLRLDSIILRIKFRVVVMYQIVLMTMAVSKFISSNGSDKSFVFFSRKPDPHALSEQNAIEQPMSKTDSQFFS
jgi:hypothetical protein